MLRIMWISYGGLSFCEWLQLLSLTILFLHFACRVYLWIVIDSCYHLSLIVAYLYFFSFLASLLSLRYRVTPNNMHEFVDVLARFNVGEDCPVFDGMYDFCKLYTGGSLDGARKLNSGQADIAIK